MTAATVDKSAERIQRMFGQISRRYDFLNHFLSLGIDISWRNFTVRTCPPKGDGPILDTCTGTGDLALAYWKAGAGRIPVVGTDFTPEMLELACKKRDAQGISGAPLTFSEADTTNLPFADNHFQIVSVAFGLRNVVNTEAGVKEMLRVCQPGGRLAILEFSQPNVPLLGWLYRQYFRFVLPRLGQLFAKNEESAYSYLPASVASFPCGQDLVKQLEAWGMTNVRVYPLTLGVASLYLGEKPEVVER